MMIPVATKILDMRKINHIFSPWFLNQISKWREKKTVLINHHLISVKYGGDGEDEM